MKETNFQQILKFREYMLSDFWKDMRYKRLKKDNFQCVLCKAKENLICHHLTYQRVFKENINDLIILCKRCHNRIHWISPPAKQPFFVNQNAVDLIKNQFASEDLRPLIESDED